MLPHSETQRNPTRPTTTSRIEIDLRERGPVSWRRPAIMSRLRARARADPPTVAEFRGWRGLLCRLGVASLFAVNGIVAFLFPEDFASLLVANPVGGLLPSGLVNLMVCAAGLNDLALAAAITVAGNRRAVWAWMALWLVLIAGVKATNLLFA